MGKLNLHDGVYSCNGRRVGRKTKAEAHRPQRFRREEKAGAQALRLPSGQAGVPVPRDGSTLAGPSKLRVNWKPALPGVFAGAWGGIRWRERDERDERIDTGGE